MTARKEIRICDRHKKQVPLIWTYAFNGSEYWCPYCGANFGMLGAGKMVPSTMKLKREFVEWKRKSKDFLRARSTTVASKIKWEGKWITYKDLPQTEKDRIQKVIQDWKYEADKTK